VIVHNAGGDPMSNPAALTVLNGLQVRRTGGGLVLPGNSAYAAGASATLTATPFEGWAFSSWSLDGAGSANPLVLTMDADKLVEANFVRVGPGCEASATGATHWWAGQNNASDSAGDAHGIRPPGARYTAGEVGRGFYFGGNDSIDLGADAGRFGITDFSMEFWIQTSAPWMEEVLSRRASCGHENYWDLFANAGILTLQMEQDALGKNRAAISLQRPVNDNAFHHVAFVRSGRTLYAYLDGALNNTVQTGAITDINDLRTHMWAGTGPCVNPQAAIYEFSGALDEITLYSVALSSSQIAGIYNARGAGKCTDTISPPLPGMTAWWPADDPPSNIATDIINGINGSSVSRSHHFGKLGQAFFISSQNDVVTIPDRDLLDFNRSLTIEAWVRADSIDSSCPIIAKWDRGGLRQSYGLHLDHGRLQFVVFSDSTVRSIKTTTALLAPGVWTHVAAVLRWTGNKWPFTSMAFEAQSRLKRVPVW
jgi:hypothetical protein